jgi:hypothetical protein
VRVESVTVCSQEEEESATVGNPEGHTERLRNGGVPSGVCWDCQKLDCQECLEKSMKMYGSVGEKKKRKTLFSSPEDCEDG